VKLDYQKIIIRAILGFLRDPRGTMADDRDESKTPILLFSDNLLFLGL